jgi:hypothetical protein
VIRTRCAGRPQRPQDLRTAHRISRSLSASFAKPLSHNLHEQHVHQRASDGVAISAALLMLASAGFGCHFAWTQGAHHGPALATFAVAMALGLELAKPFAIERVFSCLRAWAFGRALAMPRLAWSRSRIASLPSCP